MNGTPPPAVPKSRAGTGHSSHSGMARSFWSVPVVVPAWNEEKSIAQVPEGPQA